MIKDNTDLIYLLLGVGVGAMTSFARSIKNASGFTWLGFLKMCSEALTCSLLTSGLSLSFREYYGLSFSYAICIGAFIGSMGSNVIIGFAKTILENFVSIFKGKNENGSK